MKTIAILAIAFTLSACTDEEINTTGRILGGAYNGYTRNPGYYGQPTTTNTTVVAPAAPVYPYAY